MSAFVVDVSLEYALKRSPVVRA